MDRNDVCATFGLTADPPAPGTKVGISRGAVAGVWPLHGLRHQAERGHNGWYIWTGELSTAEDFFETLHVEHLVERLPVVVPYLELPPGWRFLLAPDYEDVWEDLSLLTVGSDIESVVLGIVRLLIMGEYRTIETLTRGRRLSATDLRRAVGGYGRVLTQPPTD